MASVISSQNGRPRKSSIAQFEQPRAPWLDVEGSKRWNLFKSALILAIERVASRWTYKDFEMCFPLMCEEKVGVAEDTFRDIQVLMKTLMEQNLTGVFDKYELIGRMNELDHIIRDARDRVASEEAYTGADAWRPDIPPRQAARARTVPILEAEREHLIAELAKLEEEALAKQEEIFANVRAKETAQAETVRMLDVFDEISDAWNAATEEWVEADGEFAPQAAQE